MPLVGANGLITTQPLSRFGIGWMNDQDAYIATQLFPLRPIPERTFKYRIGSKDAFRHEPNLDAPSGSEAKATTYSYTTRAASTAEYAYRDLVIHRDVEDMGETMAQANQRSVRLNSEKLLLDFEYKAYVKATTAANYPSANVTTLVDGSTSWAAAGSSPIATIRAMKDAVFASSGKEPRFLAVNRTTMQTLRFHQEIIDRVQVGNNMRTPSAEDVAAILELDAIFVSTAARNTATEGAADAIGTIWGDSAVLFHRDDNMGEEGMDYGRTFMRRNGIYTLQYDKPELGREPGAHYVENGWEFAMEFVGVTSATVLTSVAGALIVNTY